MRHRSTNAMVLVAIALVVIALPAAACSEPGSFFEGMTLAEVDIAEVAAIGQTEVVARTGWTWIPVS